jgi:hypothetical protein
VCAFLRLASKPAVSSRAMSTRLGPFVCLFLRSALCNDDCDVHASHDKPPFLVSCLYCVFDTALVEDYENSQRLGILLKVAS